MHNHSVLQNPFLVYFFSVPNIALNVDIAPTLLDIAGVTVPDHMDGRSIMKLFEKVEEPNR